MSPYRGMWLGATELQMMEMLPNPVSKQELPLLLCKGFDPRRTEEKSKSNWKARSRKVSTWTMGKIKAFPSPFSF